LEYQQRTDGF